MTLADPLEISSREGHLQGWNATVRPVGVSSLDPDVDQAGHDRYEAEQHLVELRTTNRLSDKDSMQLRPVHCSCELFNA